jgi:hypothetical protein
MNLSHAYGNAPEREYAERLIHTAYDLGVNHFDTAILYGFGKNEALVGRAIKPFRQHIHLASKCGLTTPDLQRSVNGRPENIKASCEQSLRRLQTDVIDLYYLHRWDKKIPIEESVGALSRLVEAGKINAIGLSEVSAHTLRKAHAVHPIAAVQSEYSLWTRNPEIAVLDACKELDVAFVAFSPLGRGYLTGTLSNPTGFVEKDLRNNMPRFQEPHYSANLELLAPLRALASDCGVAMAKLALAWVLAQGDYIIAIPGTTKVRHLQDNCAAAGLDLSLDLMDKVGQYINQTNISGARYNEKTQLEIDTEEFDS